MTNPIAGLITLQSDFSVHETLDRLEAAARARGMTVFARVDHAAGARSVDLELRPLELVLFGSPRAGTPLMQGSPTLGIDLPLKALAWEDERGSVWLSYDEPAWLVARHGAGGRFEETIARMSAGLADLAERAARR